MAATAFPAGSNEHATSSALVVKKACKYEFKPVAEILKELEHSTLPSLTSGDPCFETSSERRARVDFSTLPSLTSGDPSFGPGPAPTHLANVKEMTPQACASQKNSCADIGASSPCPPRPSFKVLDGLKEMMAAANVAFSPLPLSSTLPSTPSSTPSCIPSCTLSSTSPVVAVVAAPSLAPSHSTPVKSPHVFSSSFVPADSSFSIDSAGTLCIDQDPKINASFWGENFDGHLDCPYDWSVYTILEAGNETAEVQRRFWKKKLADDLEEFNRTRTLIEESFDEAPIVEQPTTEEQHLGDKEANNIEQPTNDVAGPQAKAKFMPRRNPKVAIAPSSVRRIPSSSYVVPSARVSSRLAAAAERKTSQLVTTDAKSSVRATVAPGNKSTTVARTTPTPSRATSTKSTTVAAGKTGRVGPQRVFIPTKPSAAAGNTGRVGPQRVFIPTKPTAAAGNTGRVGPQRVFNHRKHTPRGYEPISEAAAAMIASGDVPPLEECCESCYLDCQRMVQDPNWVPDFSKLAKPAVAKPAFAMPTAASAARIATAAAAKSTAAAAKPEVATTTRRNIRTASKVTQTTTRK